MKSRLSCDKFSCKEIKSSRQRREGWIKSTLNNLLCDFSAYTNSVLSTFCAPSAFRPSSSCTELNSTQGLMLSFVRVFCTAFLRFVSKVPANLLAPGAAGAGGNK